MLYRDRENSMVMGVCAGLANCFDLNPTGVRIVAFILLCVWTLATVLVYFTAGYLLRDRPLHFDENREKQFWRRAYGRRHKSASSYSNRHSNRG